uniref:Uncharacterized protein n=1 Tax=Echeneis naucrates TaxID=173247 RepID=A0A665WB72_ECHNA
MAAGTGGVCFIGFQESAALGGPVAHHTPLRVIPEGAIGVEVVLTSMCSRVKITGSLMNTRLDSLLSEAAMMSELTATETNWPRFL